MNYPKLQNCKIAIIGLGYVGLPLAIEFGKKNKSQNNLNLQIIGFDINKKRIDSLKDKIDETLEIKTEIFDEIENVIFTNQEQILKEVDVFIITVPTPIDESKKPNLIPLKNASETVSLALKKRQKDTMPVIIYESTVYPGATEEFCIKIIESLTNYKLNKNFVVGYSPERINPGEGLHGLTNVTKLTSGSNSEAADWIDNLYSLIIKKGTFKVKSIKIAEAAKVIENTQRDLNIALVNELSIIFKKLEIDTLDVLEAAGTKWNFLPFRPGLVGGHCIGIDPYYLTYRAELTGYHTQLILSGREINDGMGDWIAKELILEMTSRGLIVKNSEILILGYTFKENCPDIRNTKVIDIINTLNKYNAKVSVVDPFVNKKSIENSIKAKFFNKIPKNKKFISIIGAVNHSAFKEIKLQEWKDLSNENGIYFDIKGMMPRELEAIRL